MANLSENGLIERITDVGNRLFQPPKLVPELLNLLDEAEFILTKVGQSPSYPVQVALLIPMNALISDDLLKHSDADVRITLASCLNEVIRITAPIPPFDDDIMREIFNLIVSSFESLSCQPGRRYSRAVLILQTVAKLRSCVMMLDLGCDPLVTKMFELFQRNISVKHPQSVLLAMVNILSVVIQESDSVSLELLKVLLASIKIENQSILPGSLELGVKVLEECADKLRPIIMETVSSMGCCLKDYAPTLSSICKPELDTVANGIDDSSFLVSNETSGHPTRQAECVQALKAIEKNECTNVLGTGGVASKRGRKQNPQILDEETTGLQHVQALEASENVECADTMETRRTASLRGRKFNSQNLDEEPKETVTFDLNATGVPYVQGLEAVEICEIAPVDYVQDLVVSESIGHANALETKGTAFERVEESNSKNLDEGSSGLGLEQANQATVDDDSKHKGVIIKNMALKESWDEKDVFENKQASNSPALGGNTKRKRGRPRTERTAFKRVEESNSKNLDEESTGLKPEQANQAPVHDDSKDNGVIIMDMVLKEPRDEIDVFENKQAYNSPALGESTKKKRGRPQTEGMALKGADESDSKNLEEITGLELVQANKARADDDNKDNGVMVLKDSRDEIDVFENKQADDPPALGESTKRKRGRPRKNVIEASENKVSEADHGRTNYNDDLVGRRIKVWWPLDRRYYKGTVTLFDAFMGKHIVNYDDGDEELLNLRKQRWDFINDETSTDIVCFKESNFAG